VNVTVYPYQLKVIPRTALPVKFNKLAPINPNGESPPFPIGKAVTPKTYNSIMIHRRCFVVLSALLSLLSQNSRADPGVALRFLRADKHGFPSRPAMALERQGLRHRRVWGGYYLLDGLEAGLDGEAWLGSKPHLYAASPEVRYVFYQWTS